MFRQHEGVDKLKSLIPGRGQNISIFRGGREAQCSFQDKGGQCPNISTTIMLNGSNDKLANTNDVCFVS